MKKRKVKIQVMTQPKKKPVPIFPIEPQSNGEKQKIEHRLEELSGPTGKVLAVLNKDKAENRVGGFAHYLRVHQIAQAYECSRHGHGNGYVVHDTHNVELVLPHIEPQGNDETCRSAVASQPGVASVMPRAVGTLTRGQDHLERVCQKISRLIEQAMSEAGTDEYAKETIEKEWVELFLRQLLVAIEPHNDVVCQSKPDDPHKRIPAHAEVSDVESHYRRIPND